MYMICWLTLLSWIRPFRNAQSVCIHVVGFSEVYDHTLPKLDSWTLLTFQASVLDVFFFYPPIVVKFSSKVEDRFLNKSWGFIQQRHAKSGETAAGHGHNFIKRRRVKRVAEQIKSVSDKASPREAFEHFIVCSGPLSAGKIKHPNNVLQAQTVVRVEIISTVLC